MVDRPEHARRTPKWVGYTVTLLMEVAFTAGLLAINPVFPLGKFPIPYVLITMVAAYFFGGGPAILAGIVGWVAFTYLFVPRGEHLLVIADSPEGWAREAAFFLGVTVVAIAAIQAKKANRRIQRLADEAMGLNDSLTIEITEREHTQEALRKSEEGLRLAIRAAELGSWDFDPVTGELQWSDRCKSVFGLPSDAFVDYDVFLSRLHPEDKDRVHQLVQATLDPHGSLAYDTDYRSVWPNGTVRWIAAKGEAFTAEVDGQLTTVRFIGTVLDITERKQAEEEIRKLNEDLEKRVVERTADLENANKELEAFSYSVSHDLRAPLRAIDGFSDALLKHYLDSLDERGQDYLKRVRGAAQRMGQLIDDILGLSRATRAEIRCQDVDMSAVALEILGELRKTQPKRKVDIDVAPGLTVRADSHLMRIALGNLLGNAWKFTGNRDVARIEFGGLEQNGKRVYFVRDNGAGFNPAYVDKLFSAFQRLHSDAEFAGTGIGLALVNRILRRHGGRIWAESEVDRGATFYFTFEGG